MYADEFGWMYFMDRMGDTYRWRGENVSTVEVESVISSVLEQVDSVVYGVDVPGVEGKAGMAAIVEDAAKFDLDTFLMRLKAELPSYAIPLFVRLVNTIDITGTNVFHCLLDSMIGRKCVVAFIILTHFFFYYQSITHFRNLQVPQA